MHLQTDSAEVADIARRMHDLVVGAGGQVAPDAVFVERGGDLHVESRAPQGFAGPLLELPLDVLVPVGEEHVSPVQSEAAALFDALLAATDKLRVYTETNPRGAFVEPSAISEAILRLRPKWTPLEGKEGLLRTRALRTAHEPEGSVGLMMLVDWVNHDSRATGYHVASDALTVVNWTAPTGPECFVRYQTHADRLDMALYYGFVDRSATDAYSAPISVALPGIGTLEVGLIAAVSRARASLPAITVTDGSVHLTHLRFRADRPEEARTVVTLACEAAARGAGLGAAASSRAAQAAWTAVVDMNLEVLDDLAAAAHAHGGSAAVTVAQAAEAQREVILSGSAGLPVD